jgi:hypothetical protein
MKGKGGVIQNNVMNVNLPIADAYRDTFKKWMGGDLVEGTVTDVPAISPTLETPSLQPSAGSPAADPAA